MERKIGEIFEYEGEWYQCINTGNCSECAFTGKRCYDFSTKVVDIIGDCTGRTFKKLEKVGEPYEHYGKLYQCYKLPVKIEIRLLPDNCYPVGKDNLVEIEIKQNKEDMEEKNNAKHSNSENIGKNLRKFDLEAAKQGKPVCTRDGRKARIICFDKKGTVFNGEEFPIVALLCDKYSNKEIVLDFTKYGKSRCNGYPSNCELMMLPEKKEGWVNIDKGGSGKITISSPYSTKEEAIHNDNETTIDTIKIYWEE